MSIRPGLVVYVLSVAMVVYIVLAAVAIQRIMERICILYSRPPTPIYANGNLYIASQAVPVSGILCTCLLSSATQYAATCFLKRHRRNHNQCVHCAWPRTADRSHCPQCGLKHAKPMLLEQRFEVMCVTHRPHPLRR